MRIQPINNLVKNIELQEVKILSNCTQPITSYNEILKIYGNGISVLKKKIVLSKFDSVKDEVYFFKDLKPLLLSRYMYYHALLDIELKSTDYKQCRKSNILKQILKSCQMWIDGNSAFVGYILKEQTHLDQLYFRSSGKDNFFDLDPLTINANDSFTSRKGFTLASYYSKRYLIKYCQVGITKLKKIKKNSSNKSNLNWNKSKIDLIELLMALHANKSFNCDFKTLVSAFSMFLDLDKLDPYNNSAKIKTRHPDSRTKFIDSCKSAINTQIDQYLDQ